MDSELPEMEIQFGGADKVVVIPSPRMKPAKCILCGSVGADGRPFVDMGLYLDWYGVVYFCSYCMVAISNKLGYYTPSQYNHMETLYSAALSESHLLAESNDNLRDIVGNIIGFNRNESSDFVLLWREFKVWRESQNRSESDNQGPAEDGQRVNEQVDEQGSLFLSDNASDEFTFNIE